MRPVQNNLHLLPDDARIGSCTVYWIKWYKRFSEPFISILSGLSRGIVWGKVPYEDRKRRAVDRVVVNRRLSRHDLFVVHVVPDLLKRKQRKPMVHGRKYFVTSCM